mmetsp:Transcript_22050/g.48715  ORF Transcript_22050/g.48715 Transcript_22050/m.48715 type:complete len:204 (+) Transcript_22050:790-1401(+)
MHARRGHAWRHPHHAHGVLRHHAGRRTAHRTTAHHVHRRRWLPTKEHSNRLRYLVRLHIRRLDGAMLTTYISQVSADHSEGLLLLLLVAYNLDRSLSLRMLTPIAPLNLYISATSLHDFPDSLAASSNNATSLPAVHPYLQRALGRGGGLLWLCPRLVLSRAAIEGSTSRDLCEEHAARLGHSVCRAPNLDAALGAIKLQSSP